MRKPIAIGTAVALVAALAAAAPAQAHETRNGYKHDYATVTFFNGITDRTVDVYIDGKRKFNNVDPGDFENSLKVREGDREVAITKWNARNDRRPIVELDVDLDEDTDYTIAAHFDEDGDKTATLFENDTDRVRRGDGRLTVRHVAEAGAVDVRADGDRIVKYLKNGEEKVLVLDADEYSVKVTKHGKKRALIGPEDVDVERRTNTIVYAWGDEDNLELAIQSVDLDR